MPTLVIHIGLEKTGSTSIQHFCADNAGRLARHGLLYPKKNLGYGLYNHSNLVAAYLSDRPKDYTMTRSHRSRHDVVASLKQEIARSAAPKVLISAEHFSSRFERPQIEALWSDFEAYDKRVVIVLRNHRARFFSSYSTYVWGGGEDRLSAYADRILRPDSNYFRVKDTVMLWEQVVGRGRVSLIDYDASTDIVPAFLDRVCPAARLGGRPTGYRDKAALAPAAIEAVRRLNTIVAEKQGPSAHNLPVWLQRRYFQLLMLRTIAAVEGASRRGGWTLGGDRLRRLDEIARGDEAWLRETYNFSASADAGRLEANDDAGALDAAAADLLARALVQARTFGRWRTSAALVRFGVAFGRLRELFR